MQINAQAMTDILNFRTPTLRESVKWVRRRLKVVNLAPDSVERDRYGSVRVISRYA